MKKVICISGKAQHGKDTTATILKHELERRDNRVLIIHYADLLKFLCKTYFGWNGEKDDRGRTLLQHVGTDVVRAKKPDFWAKFVADFVELFQDEWDFVIIPDCRFPNELKCMSKNFDMTHIRVIRPYFESPLSEEQKKHISETALDKYPFEYLIDNCGTVEELVDIVHSVAGMLD